MLGRNNKSRANKTPVKNATITSRSSVGKSPIAKFTYGSKTNTPTKLNKDMEVDEFDDILLQDIIQKSVTVKEEMYEKKQKTVEAVNMDRTICELYSRVESELTVVEDKAGLQHSVSEEAEKRISDNSWVDTVLNLSPQDKKAKKNDTPISTSRMLSYQNNKKTTSSSNSSSSSSSSGTATTKTSKNMKDTFEFTNGAKLNLNPNTSPGTKSSSSSFINRRQKKSRAAISNSSKATKSNNNNNAKADSDRKHVAGVSSNINSSLKGQNQEFVDELEYSIDGLCNANLYVRCMAANTFANRCLDSKFRNNLRAHEVISKICDMFTKSLSTKNEFTLCALNILYTLGHFRLTADLHQSAIPFLLGCMDYTPKHIQEYEGDVQKSINGQNIKLIYSGIYQTQKELGNENYSINNIQEASMMAFKCLLNMTSLDVTKGNHTTVMIKSLDNVIEQCCQVLLLSSKKQQLDKVDIQIHKFMYKKLHFTCKMLESITFLEPSRLYAEMIACGPHMTTSLVKLLGFGKQVLGHDSTYVLKQYMINCCTSIIKVLLNITNCQIIRKILCNDKAMLKILCFYALELPMLHFDSKKNTAAATAAVVDKNIKEYFHYDYDLLTVGLGLLMNLVEQDTEARGLLSNFSFYWYDSGSMLLSSSGDGDDDHSNQIAHFKNYMQRLNDQNDKSIGRSKIVKMIEILVSLICILEFESVCVAETTSSSIFTDKPQLVESCGGGIDGVNSSSMEDKENDDHQLANELSEAEKESLLSVSHRQTENNVIAAHACLLISYIVDGNDQGCYSLKEVLAQYKQYCNLEYLINKLKEFAKYRQITLGDIQEDTKMITRSMRILRKILVSEGGSLA